MSVGGGEKEKKLKTLFSKTGNSKINENSYTGAPLSGRMLKLLLTDGEIVFIKEREREVESKTEGRGRKRKN